jgi:hypothetical protein
LKLKRIIAALLIVSLGAMINLSSFKSQTFAKELNSTRYIEFSGKDTFWIKEGMMLYFNGKKNLLAGKLYLNPSDSHAHASVQFKFYNSNGKLILTRKKEVKSNLNYRDFVVYSWNLDSLGRGYYNVKVICDSFVWGTLDY